MYNLPYYKETEDGIIREFIHEHPFAFLTGCETENRPVATQVPVFIEERDKKTLLSGHIMKNSGHHLAFLQNDQVLVVFHGAHTYVSATWYSQPRMASTWNYMSVHARGTIRILDEPALERILRKTSLHFENNDRNSPTAFDNLPRPFKEKMMKAIVAFEIEVSAMDHVFKLSQDRDVESYRNIIRNLKKQDENGRLIAKEMEKRIGYVFPGNEPPVEDT